MRPVLVGIVGGTGLIGSTVLKIIQEQAATLAALLGATIRVVGVTNSKTMLVTEQGVDPQLWREALAEAQDVDLVEFGAQLQQRSADASEASGQRACGVVVDCTASEAAPDAYLSWMQAGLHVVTPNKKFGAGPLTRYRAVQDLSITTGRQYLQEASVGAGLPVLTTLRSLVETGDTVLRVEGILSGTLSYIFNTYKPGTLFSRVVLDAKVKGYTEPDPREDLSGMDVARKVVILARTCGLDVTLDTLQVDSLVPTPLSGPSVTAEDYMQRLHEFDSEKAQRADAADAAGEVIRYVGCVDMEQRTASVSLVRYKKDHPFAQLQGSDNMIVFTTQRYRQQPLIVRGPGAGAEVTAAGVMTDIIQAIRCHGNAS